MHRHHDIILLATMMMVVLPLLSESFVPNTRNYHHRSPSTALFSDVEAAAPLLYKEQERLLVERGVFEEDLMKGTATPLEPSVSKGTGSAKGFSSGGGSVKKSDLKAAAKTHAKELRQRGVVRIDNVLTDDMADSLREYVLELRQESTELVESGEVKPLARFANVLLKENRCDLTIPLEDDLVVNALMHILQKTPLTHTVSSILGKDPSLYELSCLISDPGSQRQVTHPDTPCGKDDEPILYTCFIALQDIELNMGPTTWLPGTHTFEAHGKFKNDQSTAGEEVESPKDKLLRTTPSVLGILPKGSCAIFDSRVIHCGGANTSNKSRALFYCSWKNPNIGYPGNPASIRPELAGKYALSSLEKELKSLQKAAKKK